MIAFVEEEISLIVTFEAIMDLIFILDVVLQFFIRFYNENEILVKNFSMIARRYINSWFIIDVSASIPGTLIILIIYGLGGYNNDKLGTINKVTRITKY
jgi:hypothetical protein